MQKVIAITGLKGSGKDTIASIICKHDSSFRTIAFADRLKDICAVMFGWNRDMLSGRFPESREWREKPDEFWSKELGIEFTPRKALTTVGTDIIRGTLLAHIWDITVKKEIIDNPNINYIITDCRFPNEIAMIRSLNGRIVEVQRGKLPDWYKDAKKYNEQKNIKWNYKGINKIENPEEGDLVVIDSINNVNSVYLNNEWHDFTVNELGFDDTFWMDLYPSLKSIHPSERDWIGINNPEHIFMNDSSLEDLEKQVVDYFGLVND